MNVQKLIKTLESYDPGMEVGARLRVAADPDKFVAGKVTGCSQEQCIDAQNGYVVLVCEGKYPVKRAERTPRGDGGSRDLSGVKDRLGI